MSLLSSHILMIFPKIEIYDDAWTPSTRNQSNVGLIIKILIKYINCDTLPKD